MTTAPDYALTEQAADKERQQLEDEWFAFLLPRVTKFVNEVIALALGGLDSPVLVAAGGRRSDPFSFTAVQNRWNAAVKELATSNAQPKRQRAVRSDRIERVLIDANLPAAMHAQARQVLIEARQKGWTATGTQRKLKEVLIPNQRDGWKDDRAGYRAHVRRMARTLATAQHNASVLRELRKVPGMRKVWITREDSRVRSSHAHVHGQTVPIDGMFRVGNSLMPYPGFEGAPLHETINCRCIMIGLPADVSTKPEDQPTIVISP